MWNTLYLINAIHDLFWKKEEEEEQIVVADEVVEEDEEIPPVVVLEPSRDVLRPWRTDAFVFR
jgi:hypothetical protein